MSYSIANVAYRVQQVMKVHTDKNHDYTNYRRVQPRMVLQSKMLQPVKCRPPINFDWAGKMQTTSNMFISLTPSLCVYVCVREKEDIEKDATDDTNKICS